MDKCRRHNLYQPQFRASSLATRPWVTTQRYHTSLVLTECFRWKYFKSREPTPQHNRQSFCPNLWRDIISRHFQQTHTPCESENKSSSACFLFREQVNGYLLSLPPPLETWGVVSVCVTLNVCSWVSLSECGCLYLCVFVCVRLCPCVFACVSLVGVESKKRNGFFLYSSSDILFSKKRIRGARKISFNQVNSKKK